MKTSIATLDFAKRLGEAGIDEEQAEAIISALSDVHDADLSRLATEDDIAMLHSELLTGIATLRTELKADTDLLRRDITIRLGSMIVILGDVLGASKFLGQPSGS